MNKYVISLCLFLLVSCGATDTSLSTTSFSGAGFSIDIPKTWIIVDKASFPMTKNGSIALALTSPDIASGFSNNMSILQEKISETMTSKKYSIVNYALTTGEYKDFTKLEEKTLTFTDNDESNLYVFEAKYNINTPKQKFIQTAKVCGDTVYLITFGLGLNVGATSKYEDLIKTFSCTQ